MSQTPSQSFDATALFGPALAFAAGALAAGYAALSAWTTAYMNANPAVGSLSGGSTTFVVTLFVVGVAVMFLAASAAVDHLLRRRA